MTFLDLEWYWWLLIVVVAIIAVPFKIKFMKWWSMRQQEKKFLFLFAHAPPFHKLDFEMDIDYRHYHNHQPPISGSFTHLTLPTL